MDVQYSTSADFHAWIALSREVEPLFGPMADETAFQEALQQAFFDKTAFCIRTGPVDEDQTLTGGIVISKESNEIVWLAVSDKKRGQGFGRTLLEFAISKLNPGEPIFVQTFDESVPEGRAARSLYTDSGFIDFKKTGLNPAGIPTIVMIRPTQGG